MLFLPKLGQRNYLVTFDDYVLCVNYIFTVLHATLYFFLAQFQFCLIPEQLKHQCYISKLSLDLKFNTYCALAVELVWILWSYETRTGSGTASCAGVVIISILACC